MEFNASSMPFWDVSQTPMSLSQIADEDFLTLLQKQFPTDVQIPFDLSFPGYNNPAVVDPQSLSDYTHPIQLTPPSSDSGNSPVSTTNDTDDRTLKRKASDERMDVEPASKAAHTAAPSGTTSSGNSSKKTTTRRKSGNPTQDELRLLKRKEQNRAAQRAFRERKEKHVKDLEDKVEELEMKNQRTESENENLRDLLARLQEENMQLKKNQQQQSSSSQPFTFTIPKDPPATVGTDASPPLQKDSPPASSTVSPPPAQTNFFTPFSGSEFDFGSLIPFDPAVLNALDDTYTSPSTSDDVMNLDFGFGKPNRQTFNILASDPAYMSFAEPSPPDSASVSTPMNAINPFDFSTLDQWSRAAPRSNSGDTMQTFDELFGGSSNFLSPSSGIDFADLMKKSPSLVASSPVSHTNANSNGSGAPSLNSPLTSSSAASPETPHHNGGGGCPKTKEQLSETIAKAGLSSFVVDSTGNDSSSMQCETNTIPFLKKSSNKDAPMVMCRGSSFPKTEQNDKNIEVLSAWRSITSNPQFKDIDINELCTEFTNKAKCDGTKVVLEPSGVSHIIETLNAKVQQKAAANSK